MTEDSNDTRRSTVTLQQQVFYTKQSMAIVFHADVFLSIYALHAINVNAIVKPYVTSYHYVS